MDKAVTSNKLDNMFESRQSKIDNPFETRLLKIEAGDIITLKSPISGYYQVMVDSAEPVNEEDGFVFQRRFELQAWRYGPGEDWQDYVSHNFVILRWDTNFTIEPKEAA